MAEDFEALRQKIDERLRARAIHQFIRTRVTKLALDHAELTLDFTPDVDNGSGTIHGGMIAALADTAVACALSTSFGGKMGFATSNLNIHFLRRAKTDVRAVARIVKKGATICVGLVDVFDAEGLLVATVSTDFVLTTLRAPGDSSA